MITRWAGVAFLFGALLWPSCRQPVSRDADVLKTIAASIHADGSPNLYIPILEVASGCLPDGLTLQHQLYFDGLQYHSRVVIPQLHSRLVLVGLRSYEWTTISGATHLLGEEASDSASTGWSLTRLSTGALRVHSSLKNETYTYQGTLLRQIHNGQSSIQYNYSDDKLTSIVSSSPKGREILKVLYNTDGTVTYESDSGAAIVVFEVDQSVHKCQKRGAEKATLFIYRNGLLTECSNQGHVVAYEWGLPNTLGIAFFVPPAPVVVNDGKRLYSTTLEGPKIRVDFREMSGVVQGYWVWNSVSGSLLIRTTTSSGPR